MKPVSCGVFSIAGIRYRCKAPELLSLVKGDNLSADLIREPNNDFDENAIAIHSHGLDGKHIGYVPATLAKHLAPLMDNGLDFTVKITSLHPQKLIGSALLLWHPETAEMEG